MVIRILVFTVGFLVTTGTLLSAVRTVILPRSIQSRLNQVVFRTMRVLFRGLSSLRTSFEWRDRVLAHYSPIGLVTLVGVWLAMTTVGFMAMFWAVEQLGWGEAFHTSGSSLLTLGFAPVDGTGPRIMAFVEAALGLGLLALLITYLPTMYGAFSRRETLVGLLEVRAGSPPSAVGMLERYHRIGWTDQLTGFWAEWEVWFAEIEESHTSYPALTFFRSPQPERHWVNAAGTVLDGASLTLSSLDQEFQPQAALMIRSGFITLRRMADFFGVSHDADPSPGDPISISRAEFEGALNKLAASGLALVADRDQAWEDFAGWRVNYDTVLLELAQLTAAPYAPWVSDRSAPGFKEPRVRRWGRRKGSSIAG